MRPFRWSGCGSAIAVARRFVKPILCIPGCVSVDGRAGRTQDTERAHDLPGRRVRTAMFDGQGWPQEFDSESGARTIVAATQPAGSVK